MLPYIAYMDPMGISMIRFRHGFYNTEIERLGFNSAKIVDFTAVDFYICCDIIDNAWDFTHDLSKVFRFDQHWDLRLLKKNGI